MTVIGDLINNLSSSAKTVVRSLEKTQKKLIHERSSVVFSQTCFRRQSLNTGDIEGDFFIFFFLFIHVYVDHRRWSSPK